MGKETGEETQDRTNAELSTSDQEEFEDQEIGHEGPGVLSRVSQRDDIVKEYRRQQREQFRNENYTEEEIDEILGKDEEEEGEKGKPEKETGKEKEVDGDADAGKASEEDAAGAGDAEKDAAAGEKTDTGAADAGEQGKPDTGKQEPERRELTIDEVLPFKVKVKVGEEEREVPVSDLRKSFQLEGYYTKRLQEVAHAKNQYDAAAVDLARQRAQLEQDRIEFENRLFTPEEIETRKQERKRKAEEQQAQYSSYFMNCRNALYQRHPDADDLDYDQDFADFRQKHAPFLNEQLLNTLGPGAFFPLMDVVMSYYKDAKALWGGLQQAHEATTSFKKQREQELADRAKAQREQKKKAKDIKPSTSGEKKAGGDEDAGPEDRRGYVRGMREKRLAAQGLRDHPGG